MMVPTAIQSALKAIERRALDGGGFSGRRGGAFRPDATAWAILAIDAAGGPKAVTQLARKRLVAAQLPDGRVSMASRLPEAYWPTPLAVMAWAGDDAFQSAREKASLFLLKAAGVTFPYHGDPLQGHDTSINGWAWVDGTYSWVVPTALAVVALKCAGYRDHPRVREAVRLLVDRQLARGGWNYGDTYAFGTLLLPVPETTGHALCALSGMVGPETVAASLSYLREAATGLKSPLSVSWATLGIGAWGPAVSDRPERILESLALQDRYGPYDTDLLAQLVVAYFYKGGDFLHEVRNAHG